MKIIAQIFNKSLIPSVIHLHFQFWENSIVDQIHSYWGCFRDIGLNCDFMFPCQPAFQSYGVNSSRKLQNRYRCCPKVEQTIWSMLCRFRKSIKKGVSSNGIKSLYPKLSAARKSICRRLPQVFLAKNFSSSLKYLWLSSKSIASSKSSNAHFLDRNSPLLNFKYWLTLDILERFSNNWDRAALDILSRVQFLV